MSVADNLLGRLSGVKCTGRGRWIARCPAHEDRRPSLSIRELEDGRVLVHDFAECDVTEVLGAIGLDLADLFPDGRKSHHLPRERRPFYAADVLACVAFEALVATVAAANVADGKTVNRDRLLTAAARLQEAAELARHG